MMGVENVTSAREFVLEGLSSHRPTQILLFAVILLVYLLTMAGNAAVIVLIRSDSLLHTPMYFFLMNLSAMELCYATSTEPQMMAHLLTGNGFISFIGCALQVFVVLIMGTAECFLLGVMAYDRFLAIFHPLTYAIAMSKCRQWQLSSACWTAGVLFSIVYVYVTFRHSYCGSHHINHFICEMPVVLKLACGDTRVSQAVVFVLASVVLVIPVCIVLTSYGLILFSVLKMRSAASQRKAFSTCISHLVVVTVFYGTVISMYLIPRSNPPSDHDKRIAVFYTVVTPLLNPVIYTLRNKDVHGAMVKVLRRVCSGPKI